MLSTYNMPSSFMKTQKVPYSRTNAEETRDVRNTEETRDVRHGCSPKHLGGTNQAIEITRNNCTEGTKIFTHAMIHKGIL